MSKEKKEKKEKPKVQNAHLKFDAHLFENEVWLTTDKVMILFNLSRSTLYRLRKRRYIPCFKLGNSPMYPKHLLNKLFMRKSLNNVSNLDIDNP